MKATSGPGAARLRPIDGAHQRAGDSTAGHERSRVLLNSVHALVFHAMSSTLWRERHAIGDCGSSTAAAGSNDYRKSLGSRRRCQPWFRAQAELRHLHVAAFSGSADLQVRVHFDGFAVEVARLTLTLRRMCARQENGRLVHRDEGGRNGKSEEPDSGRTSHGHAAAHARQCGPGDRVVQAGARRRGEGTRRRARTARSCTPRFKSAIHASC